MKIIYRAADLSEAHIVAGLLDANGIETHVGGHYLQGGIGELPAGDFATVYVADDDTERAITIITEYEESRPVKDKIEIRRPRYVLPLLVIFLSLLLILTLTILFSA